MQQNFSDLRKEQVDMRNTCDLLSEQIASVAMEQASMGEKLDRVLKALQPPATETPPTQPS